MVGNSNKTVLITGITEQNGSFCRTSLRKRYEVHGIKRRSSSFNTSRINKLHHDPHEKDHKFFLYFGDQIVSTNILK